MPMKIVITGTSGRIGRAIHFNLCQDHEVAGVDRSVSSVTGHLGEIDDYGLLCKAFRSAAVVFYCKLLITKQMSASGSARRVKIF